MIRSLDDAWRGYDAAYNLAGDLRKLADIWDHPDLAKVLGDDNRLRGRTAGELRKNAETILDDLAVLVMFSVFESIVRARATADVDREIEQIRHPAVLRAVTDLKAAIQNGSFAKVTEAYKTMDVDLTAQVNQVRKFRNWVAHGRRDDPENNVDPDLARDRLTRYLARLAEVEAAGELRQSTEAGPIDEV